MTANFVYAVSNIYNSSNEKHEIKLSPEAISEVDSFNIEDYRIPSNASAIILFKNKITGRDSSGTPIIEEFAPTDIKQYVITKEDFLTLPKLYARYSVAKDLIEGVVGAYVLRDDTLFVMTEKMKNLFTPILESSLDKNGFITSKCKL